MRREKLQGADSREEMIPPCQEEVDTEKQRTSLATAAVLGIVRLPRIVVERQRRRGLWGQCHLLKFVIQMKTRYQAKS